MAGKLYAIYQYENQTTRMNLIFRDHTLSDLVGFVYSGMPAEEAAAHLIQNIKNAAQPLLDQGIDATVPIILDGENAWEHYPKSGREFLSRFYDSLRRTEGMEAVTVSEAITLQAKKPRLKSIVPGSWINADFNVWIGAPEDNCAWDYLHHARNFYAQNASRVSEAQRKLAFEEILIAEGSDWNWWYGPEHHSANDSDFDELYRKHLSNIYQALGATPPEHLAQPIIGAAARPSFIPQTAYIHPRISGDLVRYFEWMGAAMYTADQRSGSMHGRAFVLDSAYAGIDESNIYGRLDFSGSVPESRFELVVNLESWPAEGRLAHRELRVNVYANNGAIELWKVSQSDEDEPLASSDHGRESREIKLVIQRNFEFKLPLAWLLARSGSLPARQRPDAPAATQLRLRFSIWQDKLPLDALPREGWIELQLLSENELSALAY